jgi:drug/metabolite transporter (DMT)-like permease
MTRRLPSPLALLLLASLSWGVSTALTKVALEQLAPLDLFGIEVTTGAVCLGAIALARGARPSRPSASVLLLGALEPGLAFVLFDVGVARTSATHGALLLATDSLFTALLAAALLGERFDRGLKLALVAGFVGSVLVVRGGGEGASSAFGDLLVVLASVSAAGYGVLARRVAPGRDPLRLSAVQMLTASAIAIPLAGAAGITGDSRLGHVDGAHVIAALGVTLLGSLLPFVLYNLAISRVTATAAGLVLTLVPLFGTLASVVLLEEPLGIAQIAGGAFVIVAAVVAGRHASREEEDSAGRAGIAVRVEPCAAIPCRATP